MGLKVGDKISDFTLKDQHGETFSSEDLRKKKPLVIFFYPKDNTSECTKQACSFRDNYEDFMELGAEVVGISADSEKSHTRFADKYQFPFKLLSDTDNKVRESFKVKKSLLVVPGRETYVVDTTGRVRMVFNSMNANGHMKRAMNALKEMA
ncbi:peroxiredoxin Q/BCP [Pricia antarctica]|uniref:thioredoxin-dependent peroxiredoxin n=1 Tax=Pricia antarctica TaxID=641691 RepID=A0A1G7GC71_9FLAO|nr:peroxiredoxin [Pricia antarctica]SDE85707.1 peroxiredoxin Q/BCP [Pricia antarctica]